MQIKLNIDSQGYQAKPSNVVGLIRKRLCSAASICEVTPDQLIEAVKQGRSFTPAVMTGTSRDTWQQQQIICADIDNDSGKKDADGRHIMIDNPMTPVRALEVMEQHGIYPYFMYYSFSYTNAWPKFRIVLILREPIEDPAAATDLTKRFAGIFNQAADHCADTTAGDNARLYYGGRPDSVFYISRKATSIKRLQALPVYEPEKPTGRATGRAETAETAKEYKSTSPRQNGEIRPYSALQAMFEADKQSFDLAAYIEKTTASRPVKKGSALFFNPCPLCGHNDDFQVTGSLYHCFGASGGTGGSVIDYLMNKDGLSMGEACDKFKFDIMGYDRDEWRQAYTADKYGEGGGVLGWDSVISDDGDGWNNEDASDETGDDSSQDSGQTEAAADQTDDDGGQPFNIEALYSDSCQPVFITTSEADARAILANGGQAVALCGSRQGRKIIDLLKDKPTKNILILVPDNDPDQLDSEGREVGKARQQAISDLAADLRKLKVSFCMADICGQYKTPCQAAEADKQAFTAALAAAGRKASRPDNTADYIRQIMAGEIETLKAQSSRRTGFPNLDSEAGSIYAGLYVIGGVSSVGKTTFISQLADQMAALGDHVLFFSMEQSRLEMVSKSIARQTAAADPLRAVTSLQIRTGAQSDIIQKATAAYLHNVGDRMTIIEGGFNCTVSRIKKYTEKYIELNGGVKPVVIIDYLQVLQPDKDPETGRKITDIRMIVDHNVTELRRMSRSLEIPVFVISSVNRSNYLTPIDFESFKESGGIEFTSDVVWGLQLAAIHEDIFNGDPKSKIKEKREAIARAKEAMPREIELVCLKNRFGKSRYSVLFTYYPQFDYYAPKSKAMDWNSPIN